MHTDGDPSATMYVLPKTDNDANKMTPTFENEGGVFGQAKTRREQQIEMKISLYLVLTHVHQCLFLRV